MRSSGRGGGAWLIAALAGLYAGAGGLAVAVLLVNSSGTGEYTAIALLGAALVAGLVVGVQRVIVGQRRAAGVLLDETRLIADASRDHRIDPGAVSPWGELARTVNHLADHRRRAEDDVDQQIAAAREDIARERNLLAALMSELAVAVVVCNPHGRILLYNAAVRDLGEATDVGLERPVSTLVGPGLFEHAVAWIAEHPQGPSFAATVVRGPRTLNVSVAPTGTTTDERAGYILVLDDQSSQIAVTAERDALVRTLSERSRGAIGAIRAAVETLLDHRDLTAEQQRRFLQVVHEESQGLGSDLDEAARSAAVDGYRPWGRTPMSGADVLALVHRALAETTDDPAGIETRSVDDDLWVRIDAHAFSRALGFLVGRLADGPPAADMKVGLDAADRQVRLTVRWAAGPDSADAQAWLDEPLAPEDPATVRSIIADHGGEIWSAADGDTTRLVALFGQLEHEIEAPQLRPSESRPEFFDFDLFDRPEVTGPAGDRSLADLSVTVFDTETTGLDPVGGDQIISIGAVRIVNGRVRDGETFDVLVNPGRPVPAASTAVHGITTDQVRDAAGIAEVLPRFARFADETVLVGHNVGFDLQFLRRQRPHAGQLLEQPLLDTLLLDAAVHPDHEDHTLEAIAERLGVTVSDRHTALGDAVTTARVFVGLVSLLHARGVVTLNESIAASQATLHARMSDRLYEK